MINLSRLYPFPIINTIKNIKSVEKFKKKRKIEILRAFTLLFYFQNSIDYS